MFILLCTNYCEIRQSKKDEISKACITHNIRNGYIILVEKRFLKESHLGDLVAENKVKRYL
jgi:hypothetical protein